VSRGRGGLPTVAGGRHPADPSPHRDSSSSRGAAAVLFTPVAPPLALASLGFHAAWAGLQPCERATLPAAGAPRTVETGRTLGEFDAIFASVAWEPEVVVLARALRDSGVEPIRARRGTAQPLVVGGGPVTLSNPDLLAALCDAVFVGEADAAFADLRAAISQATGRDDALARLAAVPGAWVPAVHGDEPPAAGPAHAPPACLPTHTRITGEPNVFGDAFLVEVGRGCPRACTFCIARRGGARAVFVPAERIRAAVPAGTPRVGLLGAAVSDHPRLLDLVDGFVSSGCQVTLGSVRADRVTADLVRLLVAGGMRTLTVAADGPSEALRTALRKGLTADDLDRAAALAASAGVGRLRLYTMVGLPGETDADIDELGALVARLSARIRVAVSVSPFVPKRFTPLADAPFAGVRELKRRLATLRRSVGRTATLRAASPREAEREWRLAHARGDEAVSTIVDSLRDSGDFPEADPEAWQPAEFH
jgi:radical SAM superfamily enzyme YgiQ (UPF0313 family)